ncbi:MAG: DUF2089 domain-containing protein [Candidatus Fermentithermobacillus carboniphilus]|uniref:DUF2089 domain-containing protein n=1 Tax=Candidatus Fermentithermobacillus carboniphilus TaxID=3085328 RepID=A0AAT9LA58_9FIRM|nr:MAG: DUF2089 domain-containing protein [Candidatus Fermentithermobacillus carboniphilus]
MPNEVVGRCPVCGEALEVTDLQCPSCHTRISGSFDLCKFCKLPPEQRAFAEIFIKNRGNIREVERELGISYPTVRSRLEALIRALGYPVDEDDESSDDARLIRQRKEILDRLSRGEINATEAARLLKNLSSR